VGQVGRGFAAAAVQAFALLFQRAIQDQVGQHGPGLGVERSPGIVAPHHLRGVALRQLGAGGVPLRDAVRLVDDEGGHRVVLDDLVEHAADVEQAGLHVADVAEVLARQDGAGLRP